jgi:hypothetical protein
MQFDINSIYKSVGIDLDLAYDTLEEAIKKSVTEKDSKEAVSNFIARKSKGLFVECFNTDLSEFLIHTIAKIFVDNRIQSLISSMNNFIDSYRDNQYAIHPKYLQPKLLILRDVGRVFHNIDIGTPLEKLIEVREDLDKSTILVAYGGIGSALNNFGPIVASKVRNKYERCLIGEKK